MKRKYIKVPKHRVGHSINLPLSFHAKAPSNKETIWLFAVRFCLVPTGDAREAAINSAVLSTNFSRRGYGESAAIYFGANNRYIWVKRPLPGNSNKAERSHTTSWVPPQAAFAAALFFFILRNHFILIFPSVMPPAPHLRNPPTEYGHFVRFFLSVLSQNNNV